MIFQISFQLRSHDMCAYYSHFISRHRLCRTETGEVTEACPTLPEEEYEECELNIYCRRHELSLNILIFTHYLVICRAQISERVSMMFPHHSLCLGELLQYGLWGFFESSVDWILNSWAISLDSVVREKRPSFRKFHGLFYYFNVPPKDISKYSHLVLNFKSLIGIICLYRAARCRKATLQRWL